jgi:hypothetical protein
MPRGLSKSNAYYNNLQAWDDWNWLTAYAVRNNKGDAARRLQPPDGAGHRRIDKAIAALKAELGVTTPLYELRKAFP